MVTLSVATANAIVDATTRRLDGGVLRLYTGVRPATAEVAVGRQTPLAALGLGVPAFLPALDGSADAHPLTPDPSAAGGGTATWFRAWSAAGDAVLDGSVGLTRAAADLAGVAWTASDLMLPVVLIQAGMTVAVTAWRHTQPLREGAAS